MNKVFKMQKQAYSCWEAATSRQMIPHTAAPNVAGDTGHHSQMMTEHGLRRVLNRDS